MKKIIKHILNSLGWDLFRLNSSPQPSAQVYAALKYVNANIVYDVGANIGQFASEIRSRGFAGKIISFEPLTSAHQILLKTSKEDLNWSIHPRVAVGDFDGEIEINIAGNSVSSSVLPMLDTHLKANISSSYIAKESTQLISLDSVSNEYLGTEERLFVKIDTQGFEWQVIKGASETLKKAQGILIELSLVPLYEGQKLWLELIELLEKEGFVLWGVQKGFTDPKTGRSLQLDGIFIRPQERS